ncbi:putative polyketide synthase [Hypoxylon cercidicola]|nr:putative polyketide synthase [Hypoxylon cercidicola]
MSKKLASIDKVPPSRFNIDAYLHPSNERAGSFNVPGGYFLEDDLEAFDPSFFGISRIEAMWTDPQQKKLLEVVFEAFESSGTRLEDLAGARMGCFVGCVANDYQLMTSEESDFRHTYATTGIDSGILSNRISYVFDLKGPSLTVNTACSSSLYAVDLACKSLCSGECESAIVGGTNLILTVDQHMSTAKLGVLSPTNQSRTFDESANGYGRAEGIGALYLKPFRAAVRDGCPIRALIRSTASTSSGKHGNGITYPSVRGQMDAISLAYTLGKLNPEETSYVECHGTGTPVGDPVEVKAIHEALATSRSKDTPILIGSVKPNIGHSEASSSMGTLIKMAMALETGIIPPTAGVNKLSSAIPWSDYNVKVVTEPTSLPVRSSVQRVGVSAYGYGGTNAHAVLESVQSYAPGYRQCKHVNQAQGALNEVVHVDVDCNRPHLLVFSAHDSPTLKNNIADIASTCHDAEPIDLAYTLGIRRSTFSQRAFAIGRKLSLETDIKAAVTEIFAAQTSHFVPAFVFTGQGAQWAQMGTALMPHFSIILQKIRCLDEHLAKLKVPPSWRMEALLNEAEDTSRVNEPEYSQPLTTAVQIAIVDLLDYWGIKPVATIGHSSGEIGAAYAAGLMSAKSAITVAYYRGKVVASLRTDGAMLAVGIGEDVVSSYIKKEPFRGKVVVGCCNSPTSTTLSGDKEAITKVKEVFDEEKIFARILKTGGKAYHSHHMKVVAARYESYLRDEPMVNCNDRRRVPMYSTVRTEAIDDRRDTVPDGYWVENLCCPVLFEQGVAYMLNQTPAIDMLIEIGPHPALEGPLRQICQAYSKSSIAYAPTLKRKAHDADQMLRLAGILWARNAPIDLSAVIRIEHMHDDAIIKKHTGSLLVDLPPYHWTYTKPCLAESRRSREHRTTKEPRHDLLGRRLIGTSALEPVWRNVLQERDLPWLAQHRLGKEVMLPATGYFALAIEAITQINSESEQPLVVDGYTIRDLVISAVVVVPDDDVGTETMFSLRPTEGTLEISRNGRSSQWYEFVTSCYSNDAWKETARGRISLNVKGQRSDQGLHVLPELTQSVDHIEWLNRSHELGVDIGPAFRHVGTIYTDGKTYSAKGEMRISQTCGLMDHESRYVFHPTVMDSCLQPGLEMTYQGRLDDFRCYFIPTHFAEITIFPPSAEQLVNRCSVEHWSPQGMGNRSITSNVQLIGHDDELLVDITGFTSLQYPAAIPQEMQGNLGRDLYAELDWKVDIDYLRWANDANALSDDPVPIIVDAVLHKNPGTRILCLDMSLDLSFLASRPNLKTDVISVSFGNTATQGLALTNLNFSSGQSAEHGRTYGLIIAPKIDQGAPYALRDIRQILAPGAHVIFPIGSGTRDDWDSILKAGGFYGANCILPRGYMVATAEGHSPKEQSVPLSDNKAILLVYRDTPSSLLSKVYETLKTSGYNVRSESIGVLCGLSGERVVLLADTEGPLLNQLEQKHLDGLKSIIEGAGSVIWVTCGGLLEGDRPEYSMTMGAARTIRNETGSSTDLVTLDFDEGATSERRVADLVVDILVRQQLKGLNGETEYCMKNGAVYVARLIPHQDLNQAFVPDSGETITLHQCDRPFVRSEYEHGMLVYHDDHEHSLKPLGANEVEIHVAAMGLAAADGANGSPFLNHQLAGIVTRAGQDVQGLNPGTKVIGFALDRLATFQRTSIDLIHPILPEMSLTEAASLPSAFATAIYALENLARIEPGENVVIIDGMGTVALAAIQLCHIVGANAILVSSSAATEEFLRVNKSLIPVRLVSGSRDGLCRRLATATGGKGVDIVMSSAAVDGSLIEECAQASAPFGRTVIFGHSNNTRPLTHSWPTQTTSLFRFDLADLIRTKPRIISKALRRCVQLLENGSIRPLHPIHIGGPDCINQAIHSIPSDLGAGCHVIVYDESSSFKVVPSAKPVTFKGDATYLFVGGLGGLARQVALWMADRGAKRLVFISRTGASTPSLMQFIQSFQDRGIDARALRADITCREELQRAVAEVDSSCPIRGVVNAANVLHDSLFQNMTIDAWKKVTQTKVKGCFNLHEVFKDQPLDFFVMTSSVASMLGSSGQSNYSAANSVLDSIALHRTSRGLPAVSLVLPAIFGIGMISERPELEQMIKVKGMYGIEEKEMLEAFEIAMRPHALLPRGVHHMVVGVQPRRMGQAIKSAGVDVPWGKDPRLDWLTIAMQRQAGVSEFSTEASVGGMQDLLATIQRAATTEDVVGIVTVHIVKRLARLLMIETESVQPTQKSVAGHGLDSMIGAEFRNWLAREFKVNVPFQQLLAGSLTISELARTLCEKVRES